MRFRSVAWGILAALVIAVLVLVLLPASDPLEGAETVYLEISENGTESPTASEIHRQLEIVLNERNLRIATDRERADVDLEITEIRLNLGDVEFSLQEGRLRGRACAVVKVPDERAGRRHTMDLTVRVQDGRARASLMPRKF